MAAHDALRKREGEKGMSEFFVVGDIHGNYRGLIKSLDVAGWQEGDTSSAWEMSPTVEKIMPERCLFCKSMNVM